VIRGIIFDVFGVLYHGSLGYLREIAPAEHLDELNDISHSYDYGYISQSDYFRQVGQLLGKSAGEIAAVCREQHVRNEALVTYVHTLRPAYKTAILSNIGRGFVDELFTKSEASSLFDAEILSSEVGLTKPSPEIYRLAASRLGLDPAECVMIDDIPDNVDGAMAVGMRGIVYQSLAQMDKELSALLRGVHA
jgi:putative hydrolase of the HAD superfamily